jgi:hypothetical protein
LNGKHKNWRREKAAGVSNTQRSFKVKKNRFLVFRMLAMLPAFGLILAGCDHGSEGGGGGNPTPMEKFQAQWGRAVAVVNENTVRLADDVIITGSSSSVFSVDGLRLVNLEGSYEIPEGITLIVPRGNTLKVGNWGELDIRGTLELQGRTESTGDAGNFEVNAGTVNLDGDVKVKEGAGITVNGGTVNISANITAGANTEIKFFSGHITIKEKAVIKAESTTARPKISVGTAADVEKETGAKITEDMDIDQASKDKIKEVAPPSSGGTGSNLPALQGDPVVSYNSTTGAVKVTYTFNMNVTASFSGWTIDGNGTRTITATPASPKPGTAAKIELTAANAADASRTTKIAPVTVMPVSKVFARNGGTTGYRVEYYDAYGVTGLKNGGAAQWYLVTDTNLKKIFNAIYTPNAPGTTDTIESGKTTIAYDAGISQAALSLFTVTVGSNANGDKIEIKGTALPAKTGASNKNLIVIDIGISGEDNTSLKFYIPYRELGTPTGAYGHIRFRVNRGAEAVILADNSRYINNNGAGNASEPGYFNNGCIEVMAGGKLRDGAYEGFPLGSNAVILNNLGSYLAVGPESSFSSATAGYAAGRDKWYEGWLIGPSGSGNNAPRIVWDSGDQSGSYIEVRPGKLAISANVTVKKTLGLIYSVWFVNGPTVTIDAVSDNNTPTIAGKKGLFANGTGYKFYGTKTASGGTNIGNATATIVIRPGSTLHKMFLTSGNTDLQNFITAGSSNKVITNKGNGSAQTYETGITGYPEWEGDIQADSQ